MSDKKVVSTTTFTFEQKPDSSTVPSSAGAYTTEDISRGTHVTRATFKPSSEAPSYATLPRGGQTWKGDVDENFNSTYVSEANSRSEWDPNIISNVTRPPEPIKLLTTPESIRSATSVTTESSPYSEGRVHKGFERPQPAGRGARRFDEPSHESYGYKPPLTTGSIGSDEDFNMANGESSSQDSGPHYASINRPAMNQFRKQKVNAEIEATKEPKPLPKKVPPPPPAKPERRYPNILEQDKYKGPSRPAIKKGNRWYKEMFKEMHSTAGASSNLSALLANDAVKSGEEQKEEDYHAHHPPPPSDFIHPMHARPVESMNEEPDYKPSYTSPHVPHVPERPYVSPTHTQPVSPPGGHQEAHVPTWYQDMLKGEQIPAEEPLSYGVHRKQHSYDSGDEVKHRFSGPHAPVHANRPPDYVAPLSRSAADRPMHKPVPTTVTVQQEERSKPPTATSMYESRFRAQATPGSRSASEELGVKQKPPSDEDLIRKREEEAQLRREEEERRRQEEEREMIRQQQEERQRREREAEQRRRKLEAEEAARKAAERPQFFAMALYTFDAQNPKELSFRKGDYIIVKRQIDRNWIEGELKGKVGIFPTNYVELRPIEDEEEEEEEAPVESPPSPYVPVEGEAKVKYNFRAESGREISVGKGEIVILTRKVDQNWYEGISQGRKGILPAAYLELLREPGLVPKASLSPKGTEQPRRQEQFRREEVIRKTEMPKVSQMPQEVTEIRKTTTTTTTYDRSGQPTSYGEPIRVTHSGQPQMRGGPPQPQSQVKYISKEPEPSVLPAQVVMDEQEMFPLEGERFKAAFSYHPQNDDELPLEEGEEVIVLEKCDDGWFVGHSTRTGLFGTFPGNYVVGL